jgi:hypothetical protein
VRKEPHAKVRPREARVAHARVPACFKLELGAKVTVDYPALELAPFLGGLRRRALRAGHDSWRVDWRKPGSLTSAHEAARQVRMRRT